MANNSYVFGSSVCHWLNGPLDCLSNETFCIRYTLESLQPQYDLERFVWREIMNDELFLMFLCLWYIWAGPTVLSCFTEQAISALHLYCKDWREWGVTVGCQSHATCKFPSKTDVYKSYFMLFSSVNKNIELFLDSIKKINFENCCPTLGYVSLRSNSWLHLCLTVHSNVKPVWHTFNFPVYWRYPSADEHVHYRFLWHQGLHRPAMNVWGLNSHFKRWHQTQQWSQWVKPLSQEEKLHWSLFRDLMCIIYPLDITRTQ